jgi:hypothetical protein
MIRRVMIAAAVALSSADYATASITVDFDPSPAMSFSGGELHPNSANFTQDGAYVESFWADQIGSPAGFFTAGHFHIGIAGPGQGFFEGQHWNGFNQLQGFFVEAADGSPFSLQSLQFRVRSTNPQIAGFSSGSTSVLLSTSFDPDFTVASQFTAFNVGGTSSTFSTLPITGFENVTRVFIASSSSVDFDNIVLDDPINGVVPEPMTLFVWSGLACIGGVMAYKRRVA